jgi:predicted nucleic acid-binding protein
VTSPKRVTSPYTSREAVEFIEALLSYEHVIVLPISPDVPSRWMALLKDVEVRGPRIFDLQIAATMFVHGVTKIFTYNGADFEDLRGIQALEPQAASSGR